MQITAIVGPPGSGKTMSFFPYAPYGIKGLPLEETIYLASIKKPTPKHFPKAKVLSDINDMILYVEKVINSKKYKIGIIDDFNYLLGKYNMKHAKNPNFNKWTDIAVATDRLISLLQESNMYWYITSHSTTDSLGREEIMTVGSMVNVNVKIDGICVPILFTGRELTDKGEIRVFYPEKENTTARSLPGLFVDESGFDLPYIPADCGYVHECLLKYNS